jgi:electron transfer flavoprotein alpha subunit
MPRMFAYVVQRDGVPDDIAAELVAAAARMDPTGRPTALVTGSGPSLEAACQALRGLYPEVWKLEHEGLARHNAEVIRQALVGVLPQGAIVLIAHDHLGVDLAPGLSIKLNAALASDVIDAERVEQGGATLVRQEFGGQVNARVRCQTSAGVVITIRPGAFRPGAEQPASGQVVDMSSHVGPLTARRRYLETVIAETGDVDITKEQVLVSVGRGIQDQENVPIAQDLADAMGAAVSCSRPVADAKWLGKSRQVGSSGRTVKPKVYVACGISGSFQHLAGIKGSPFIVAINKNPKAPIFRVADVGIVDDILEFIPALTARIRAH